MTDILVLKSSASGAASVSNRLIDGLIARLRRERPTLRVIERDLDRDPIPHLVSDTLAGIGPGTPGTASGQAARTLSDRLIAELQAADLVVLGAPMYNFGIASTLKSWFDHVLRAGITFRYGPDGPEGLVAPKPVLVIETRGGAYPEGPAATMDSQEPHLRTLLGFIGLTDVTFVRAENLAMGTETAAAAIGAATERLAHLSPAALARAA